jgi:alkyl sulfatase BDS1-like metallo-beta-lactamase superfamily hydrolase
VKQQRPAAYEAMARSLDGLSFRAAVEDPIVLRSDAGVITETRYGGHDDVRLTTDRRTLQALVAGETTLNASLRSGALDLAGTTEALSRAMNALEYFVCALLVIDDAEELRRDLDEPS